MVGHQGGVLMGLLGGGGVIGDLYHNRESYFYIHATKYQIKE